MFHYYSKCHLRSILGRTWTIHTANANAYCNLAYITDKTIPKCQSKPHAVFQPNQTAHKLRTFFPDTD